MQQLKRSERIAPNVNMLCWRAADQMDSLLLEILYTRAIVKNNVAHYDDYAAVTALLAKCAGQVGFIRVHQVVTHLLTNRMQVTVDCGRYASTLVLLEWLLMSSPTIDQLVAEWADELMYLLCNVVYVLENQLEVECTVVDMGKRLTTTRLVDVLLPTVHSCMSKLPVSPEVRECQMVTECMAGGIGGGGDSSLGVTGGTLLLYRNSVPTLYSAKTHRHCHSQNDHE